MREQGGRRNVSLSENPAWGIFKRILPTGRLGRLYFRNRIRCKCIGTNLLPSNVLLGR